jgi:putative oxidoreductase
MRKLISWVIGFFEMIPHWFHGLLARVAIALVFWNSGRTKVPDWNFFAVNETTLQLFTEDYKVPFLSATIAAYMAQTAEHVFPILLIIGLASRFSALALLGMTLVIEIFVYPEAYVVHGTWAAILIFIMKYGPGMVSLDYLIRKRR